MVTGGNPINVPNVPAAIAIDTGAGAFTQVLQYRSQNGQYAASLNNLIAQYITGFSSNVDEIVLAEQTNDERQSLGSLLDLGRDIASNLNPIINTLSDITETIVQNQQPTIDLSDLDLTAIINAVVEQLDRELTQSQDNIAFFRSLIESIISLALLDSSYQLLGTDVTDINNIVTNFINRRKSQVQTDVITVDRQSLNELDLDGVLDSDIAAETIARANARRDRIFDEIDAEAEELRVQQLNVRLTNRIQVMQTKVSAGNIIPDDLLRLNPNLYGLIGDLIRDKFFNVNSFVTAMPNILATASSSLRGLNEVVQNERVQQAQVSLGAGAEATKLFQLFASNLSNVAQSAGKLATFEAV